MSDILPQKVCACCKQSFPATLEYFYKNKIYKDGLLIYCKPCQLAKNKRWRDENPERWQSINRANSRKWLKDHPEEGRAQRRKSGKTYYLRHTDKIREQARIRNKERYHENKLQHIAQSNNQRAKMRKSRGRIKAADLNLIYDCQKGLCWWCGKPLNGVWRLDHRIALAKGGSNELNNLCAACPECNARKSDKWPWQFNGRLI